MLSAGEHVPARWPALDARLRSFLLRDVYRAGLGPSVSTRLARAPDTESKDLFGAKLAITPRASPEPAVAQQDVQDRADAPDERDDDPDHLFRAAQVGAADDVDHAQDPGDRVEKDRQEDLDDELEHLLILSPVLITLGKGVCVVLLTRHGHQEALF